MIKHHSYFLAIYVIILQDEVTIIPVAEHEITSQSGPSTHSAPEPPDLTRMYTLSENKADVGTISSRPCQNRRQHSKPQVFFTLIIWNVAT